MRGKRVLDHTVLTTCGQPGSHLPCETKALHKRLPVIFRDLTTGESNWFILFCKKSTLAHLMKSLFLIPCPGVTVSVFAWIDLAMTSLLANQPFISQSERAHDRCQRASETLPLNLASPDI